MNVLLIGNLAEDRQESMQRFARMLRDGLQSRGHHVTVLAPTLRLARFGPRYRFSGLPKFLGYFDKFILFPRQLRRFIRQDRPDVVHIVDHSNAVYVSAVQDVPALATCHDLLQLRAALGEVARQPVGKMGRRYQAWIRASLGRLRLIACVSSQTRHDVLRLIPLPAAQVARVPNALNFPYQPLAPAAAQSQLENLMGRHATSAATREALRAGFLLHVGGDHWYKNREGVLALYAALRTQLSPVPQLVMVGPRLAPVAVSNAGMPPTNSREGVTVFHDVTNEELTALYNLAQALIFPSWEEGFGWPIAEAQACGCPVFTTNRAPMTEVGGESSFYFDPEDPVKAARVIADAWPTRFSRRALALIEAQRWQPALMLEAYETLYRQLAG